MARIAYTSLASTIARIAYTNSVAPQMAIRAHINRMAPHMAKIAYTNSVVPHMTILEHINPMLRTGPERLVPIVWLHTWPY